MLPFTSPLLELAKNTQPSWANDVIQSFPEARYRRLLPYVMSQAWQDAGDINVFSVIGTRHPDYIGLTWLEFLGRGKRMPLNHRLWGQNPGYYTADAPKQPSMSYISLDGTDWYVDGDGNHRTAIARFDFAEACRTQLHGVTLFDYRFDELFADTLEMAKSVLMERRLGALRHENHATSRVDASGWKLDRYINSAYLMTNDRDIAARFSGALDTPALLRLIDIASLPRWRRWFRLR